MDYSKKVIKKLAKDYGTDEAKAVDKKVGSAGITKYRLKQALERKGFDNKAKNDFIAEAKKMQVKEDKEQAKIEAAEIAAKEKIIKKRNLIMDRIRRMRPDGDRNVKASANDLNVSSRNNVAVTAYGSRESSGFAKGPQSGQAGRLFQGSSNPFVVNPFKKK